MGREFTVGIVTYDRPESLARLFESLLEQTRGPEEVFVVDDSDDDRTEATVAEYRPSFQDRDIDFEYRHRANEKSMPGARNEIIDATDSDVVCFLDDDVVLEDDWLESLADGYDVDEDVAGVGGPAIKADADLTPLVQILEDGKQRNTIDEYGAVSDFSDRWIPQQPVEVDLFRGANMSFRRSDLEEIGGFDTRYEGPAIFEEWDVMARLRRRDKSLYYAPGAKLYHIEESSGGSRSEGADRRPGSYWYAKNSLLFRRRNFGDVYWQSLTRLLLFGTPQLPSVLSRVGSLFLLQFSAVYWLQGYLHGLVESIE